ncbi:MAG TPA: nucleotidyltransferase domain-containing protein [Chloroflexota bacterium]|nr:nucleotidyltransferase domain-containing protein [Chloroflexota bacterium]HUM70908.1 nucleotidyltransferase domain-containing protein [Chloroflexota bacterium]
MEHHHQEAIATFLDRYQADTTILAVLLGGSLAHGFAASDSDIDLSLIVDEAEYARRKQEHKLAFSLWDICTYAGGYVDCKVVSLAFLQKISERGSDPARYAFKDATILFSRIENLGQLLTAVSQFPTAEKESRRQRFAAQLLAWRWFYSEGVKKENSYLMLLAVQKMILFSCRLVLNENEMLYPYHKWLLRETEKAQQKPARFDETIQNVLAKHDLALVNELCAQVMEFLSIEEKSLDWPNHFLHDSELNWMAHEPPIDDL